jgi:hypothetical protein
VGKAETGLLLVDPLGKPVRPELYSDSFRRLTLAARSGVIHLYLVRRTLAVAMDRAGVAQWMPLPAGHTVDVYVSTHLSPSEQGARSAAHALGTHCQDHLKINWKRWPFTAWRYIPLPGNVLSLGALLSGWRDLNSRPLDPQIGPRLLSCVNHISPVSIVDRWRALSSAGVVRSWSVVSPHSPARS